MSAAYEPKLREYESAASADHFTVESTGPTGRGWLLPKGHEILTKMAATGLVSSLEALVAGVRAPDVGLPTKHFIKKDQKRHALRSELCQETSQALNEIERHLVELHAKALRTASSPLNAWKLVGECLHLIQDSYSEAHTERDWNESGPPHPIRYVRYFGPEGQGPPVEHQVFRVSLGLRPGLRADRRDIITNISDGPGRLRRAAREAVSASREFLRMMKRHLGNPRSPRNRSELSAYMARHLPRSPNLISPRRYYRCR